MKKYLALGFDTERPYGDFANTPKGKDLLKRMAGEFLPAMNERFNAEGIPRTHFLLGTYLRNMRDKLGDAVPTELFDPCVVNVGQHSNTHPVMSVLQGVDKIPFSTEEYSRDLKDAAHEIEDALQVTPHGLRTPYGYPHDLSHRPDILAGMRDAGLTFVSADLGPKNTLDGPVTKERQPHTYARVGFPDIVEVPAHGLQDVVFTKEKAATFRRPQNEDGADIVRHYLERLSDAEKLELDRVSVALCLHPWAVAEYDPDLTVLCRVVSEARQRGFEVVSYARMADLYREDA